MFLAKTLPHPKIITNEKAVFLGQLQPALGWERFDINTKLSFLTPDHSYRICVICFFKDTDKFVEELVSPVLNCLLDPEVRVRLFASESLYNIVKVARGSTIPLFPRIFSALSRLVTGKTMFRSCQIRNQPIVTNYIHLLQIRTKIARMEANYQIDC